MLKCSLKLEDILCLGRGGEFDADVVSRKHTIAIEGYNYNNQQSGCCWKNEVHRFLSIIAWHEELGDFLLSIAYHLPNNYQVLIFVAFGFGFLKNCGALHMFFFL
jgi:hypothetical protein